MTGMTMDQGFVGWVGDIARRHAVKLAGVARAEGLSATDALDAVQEGLHSFLLLPQARGIALDPEDVEKLVTVIVRNVARNMRRRHHRSRPHDSIEEADVAAPLPSVDELIERAEAHIKLLGCMQYLGEIQRSVMTLRMLEEMSGEDVARELGLSAGHVAVLLHRAKAELLRCMFL